MSQEKKFHASPAMIRNLYQKFGPSSEEFYFDYDDFQVQYMKFTVIERIVDSLIQRIRNIYNFTNISNDKAFLPNFEEIENLYTYYSSSTDRRVKKVLGFLKNIKSKRDEFFSNEQNLDFLIFVQSTFTESRQSLKKILNDRIELGLYYHEKFTFFDKLIKSIQQQLKKAEDLSNEFEQIISINKTPEQNDDLNEEHNIEEEEDNNDNENEPLIKKFVTNFKNSLSVSNSIYEENDD